MKRKAFFILALILCSLLCACLVACGSENGTSDSKEATTGTTESKHTHIYGEWDVVKVPTCVENGERIKTCNCGDEIKEVVAATGHTESAVAGKAPSCNEDGLSDGIICSSCQEVILAQNVLEATGHTWETVSGYLPTCTENGLTDGVKCAYCEEVSVKQEVIISSGHSFVDGSCTSCGVAEPYRRDGNKIYFGSYPQSMVNDTEKMGKLSALSGALPTRENPQEWTDYGYYLSNSQSSYMWYIDIGFEGEKYRGVYFTSFRSNDTSKASSSNHQSGNGYACNNIYWFKFEPISWTVLKEQDGQALILCDMILDSQAFHTTPASRELDETTVYANNYEYSAIRAWLNEDFYDTAFSSLQRELILVSQVDNSASSTGYDTNKYACCNTQDKIFLLSAKEVMSSEEK